MTTPCQVMQSGKDLICVFEQRHMQGLMEDEWNSRPDARKLWGRELQHLANCPSHSPAICYSGFQASPFLSVIAWPLCWWLSSSPLHDSPSPITPLYMWIQQSTPTCLPRATLQCLTGWLAHISCKKLPVCVWRKRGTASYCSAIGLQDYHDSSKRISCTVN